MTTARTAVPPVHSVLGTTLMRPPRRLTARIRWHVNRQLVRRPRWLNRAGATLTVVDAYGTPGDTLLTAIVCRHVRQWYPRLRINCLTPNPDLLVHDPNIDAINEPESFFSLWSWYPETEARKTGAVNVLAETFAQVGKSIDDFEYRTRVYLTREERDDARTRVAADKPILTFHTRTREEVKEWPVARWVAALAQLRARFHLVHLGDAREPDFEGVQRLAGRLTMRESMAVLSHARVHVGADSFLMHAANGLDVPSVIIFGGSRPPSALGYAENVNLFVPMTCGPCWLHPSRGDRCEHDIACMDRIEPSQVVDAVDQLMARS